MRRTTRRCAAGSPPPMSGATDFPIQNLPFAASGAPAPARRSAAAWRSATRCWTWGRCMPTHPSRAGAARALAACTAPALNALMAQGRRPRRRCARRSRNPCAAGAAQEPLLRGLLVPQQAAEYRVPARDRRLHRLLCLDPPRDHRRAPDAPRQPAAAELQVGADRLPRPRLVGARLRVRLPPPERPAAAPGRDAAVPRPRAAAGLRAGGGHVRRQRQRARQSSVPLAQAEEHLFGLCLLNDWSARDIQGWEYQPLGPFLAKNFATTVSPWVVTLEALAPFRCPPQRPPGEPAPLAYLDSAASRAGGAIDVHAGGVAGDGAACAPRACRRSGCRSRTSATRGGRLAQMLTHHTVNGCNLKPGDLLGSGTQSGPKPGAGRLAAGTERRRQAADRAASG